MRRPRWRRCSPRCFSRAARWAPNSPKSEKRRAATGAGRRSSAPTGADVLRGTPGPRRDLRRRRRRRNLRQPRQRPDLRRPRRRPDPRRPRQRRRRRRRRRRRPGDRRPRRRHTCSAAPATATRSPAASASTPSAAAPATTTSSTATTATTAWTAAPASGDIASFATDVGAGQDGGVKVSLAKHRARGDGHDRLFRFESIEGSAFDDILIGDKQDNAIDGGPGNDDPVGGGGHDILNGDQGTDRCKGAKGRTSLLRQGKAAERLRLRRSRLDARRRRRLAIVGLGGPDHFIVAYDAKAEIFGVTRRKGDRGRARLHPAGRRPTRSPAPSAARPAG